MQLLVFILVYPLIWFLSILPFRILYFISDVVFILIYHIIGYRKKVVLNNLQLAFPEKPLSELLVIRKKFYQHFVDVFIEMIKSFTISEKEIKKHYTFPNIDFCHEMFKDGKSVILTGAHYGNWEWIMSLNLVVDYKGYAAYTKVNNRYFNAKILKTRQRFKVVLKRTVNVIKAIEENKKNNVQAMYGLLSDQSPQLKKTHYWANFLNVKVPVHTGAEMLTKKYDMNMIFMDVQKVKRGYYETTFSLITKDATNIKDYELTDIYLRKVEKQVYDNPEFYFWTHKRFKHKDKAPT